MYLQLRLSNERRALSSVRAFTQETLRHLETAGAEKLEEIVLAGVADAVDHAYPPGEEGSIQLTIEEKHGKLEVLVRDYGLPPDVDLLERRLHEAAAAMNLFGCPAADVADEVHWLAYGPRGKAIQIVKWLDTAHVAESAPVEALAPLHDDMPAAPPQEYTIRRLHANEAVEVSQLMYRAYGSTYFNQDVYYPKRVAAQNARDAVMSFVAQGEDGRIVGHYALEFNQDGPVAEGGQAVVDPAHRARGLLDRLKEAALEEARRRDLVGWYADAVGVHLLTQKSNVTHGGHLTCVDLAISPKTEQFRNIAEKQPQRVTCLLYFHWLKPPALRTVHVPERHGAIVSAIYEGLECAIRFGERAASTGNGTLTVKADAGAASAVVRAERLGEDTVRSIRHAKRGLVERSHMEVVYVELPLADPATPQTVEELEGDGFGFIGVAPHFSTCGDLLRLAYLVEPLSRAPIKTFDESAARLVDYALAEQTRVREPL